MRKLLLGLLLVTSSNVFAAPVFLYPNCSFSMNNGQCTLINSSGKDINCNITINGRTKESRTINAREFRFLYSGMMAWINVYSSFNDPITSLNGTASCNTVN